MEISSVCAHQIIQETTANIVNKLKLVKLFAKIIYVKKFYFKA